MYSVYLCQHEGLYKKVLFKPVLAWIQDTLAYFGITRLVIVPDVDAVPQNHEERIILLDKPVIFSPLINGGYAHVRWPGGEIPIPWGCLPVSTPEELQKARSKMRTVIIERHIKKGVDIADPATTFIGPDVTIGEGVTILPGVVIQGCVTIGSGCEIGPFTNIRPDVTLGMDVKAGAFTELKNSVIGDGTQISHLAYIGDSDVGDGVNIGCGTVTVNYDGAEKHRTVINDGAFIGCNTNLVAPVEIGAGAYTAAGSTITQDVPSGLGIARARQENKPEWVNPKQKKES